MKKLKGINSYGYFFWYLSLVSFFLPLGFQEYFPVYKKICVALMLVSTGMALILLLQNWNSLLKIKNSNRALLAVLAYHVLLLILTLYNQGTINEGLKKIFIAPVLCYLLYIGLKKSDYIVMNVLGNILTVVLFLNITIFNAWLWKSYFSVSSHLVFLGHVQIVSQVCILGVIVSYALKTFYGLKRKGNLLILLSLMNLIYCGTIASLIVIALLLLFIINKKIRNKTISQRKRVWILVFSILLVSALFIFLPDLLKNKWIINNVNITMSGRFYIWQEGLRLAKERIISGYGAYGVLIKVFWNTWIGNENGANYAHNMILQVILDGGIILVISFVLMLFSGFKSANRSRSPNDKYWFNAYFIIFLIIGLIESVQEYFYFFAFIILYAMLPYYRTKRSINIS